MSRILLLLVLLAPSSVRAEDLSVKPDTVLVHHATIDNDGASFPGMVVLATQELGLVPDRHSAQTVYVARYAIGSVVVNGNVMRIGYRKSKSELVLKFDRPESAGLVSAWLGVQTNKPKKK